MKLHVYNKPRFNETLYNEPRYKRPRFNEVLDATNEIRKAKQT